MHSTHPSSHCTCGEQNAVNASLADEEAEGDEDEGDADEGEENEGDENEGEEDEQGEDGDDHHSSAEQHADEDAEKADARDRSPAEQREKEAGVEQPMAGGDAVAGAVTGNETETARDDPRERAWQVRVLDVAGAGVGVAGAWQVLVAWLPCCHLCSLFACVVFCSSCAWLRVGAGMYVSCRGVCVFTCACAQV